MMTGSHFIDEIRPELVDELQMLFPVTPHTCYGKMVGALDAPWILAAGSMRPFDAEVGLHLPIQTIFWRDQ